MPALLPGIPGRFDRRGTLCRIQAKQERIAQEVERLKRTPVGGDAETNAILRELGTTELRHGITAGAPAASRDIL